MDKKIGVPNRKKNRLGNYDYSSSGAYFLTVCTSEKRNYLGKIVGAISDRPPKAEDLANALGDHYIYNTPQIELSEYGRIVEQAILQIPSAYPALSVLTFTYNIIHVVFLF